MVNMAQQMILAARSVIRDMFMAITGPTVGISFGWKLVPTKILEHMTWDRMNYTERQMILGLSMYVPIPHHKLW